MLTQNSQSVVNGGEFRLHTLVTLKPVSKLDFLQQITSLQGGSAPDFDGVLANIFKTNEYPIFDQNPSSPFNSSLSSGIFPNV